MIDLLVCSLTADGGLENALESAVKVEMGELEENQRKCKNIPTPPLFRFEHENLMSEEAIRELQAKNDKKIKSGPDGDANDEEGGIPLLTLLRQLLKNSAAGTAVQIQNLANNATTMSSTTTNTAVTGSRSRFPVQNMQMSDSEITRRKDKSPSLLLLLRFQRLLFSHILYIQNQIRLGDRDNGKILHSLD